MSVRNATRSLFLRYLEIILRAQSRREDALAADPRLSLENLAWMCRTGAEAIENFPEDKSSRWLGFVQGCLAMRGLISVDEERDVSRPLFHAAWKSAGVRVPAVQENRATTGG